MLDVCVVKKAPLSRLYLEIALVYLKKHTLFSNVKVFRCKEMKAILDKPRWIHLDGETPVKVKKVYYSIEHNRGITFVK
jgi:diacylglycerol kinase family enzyme